MGNQMECGDYIKWLFLFLLIINSNLTAGIFLPSIIWDPYHPLFSCTDKVIYARQNDILRFICPDADLSSNPDATSSNLYEKALLLGDGQLADYNSCNATINKALVECTGQYKSVEYFVKDFAATPDLPVFESGKTYFVIGTSYRYQNNINNLIGGSCSNATDSAHHLKLKIHVCTDKEIKNRKCPICTTQGCYYKSCDVSCSTWSSVGVVKKQSQCYLVEKRSCNNTVLQEYNKEYRENAISCEGQVVTSAARGSTDSDSDSDEADKYKYVSAGVAVIGLVIGLVVGIVCYKNYHNRNCGQKPISPAEMESNGCKASHNMEGKVNNAYRNSAMIT